MHLLNGSIQIAHKASSSGVASSSPSTCSFGLYFYDTATSVEFPENVVDLL